VSELSVHEWPDCLCCDGFIQLFLGEMDRIHEIQIHKKLVSTSVKIHKLFFFLLILTTWFLTVTLAQRPFIPHERYTQSHLSELRHQVRDIFYHAYEGYLKYAYPLDELQPLTCRGVRIKSSFFMKHWSVVLEFVLLFYRWTLGEAIHLPLLMPWTLS